MPLLPFFGSSSDPGLFFEIIRSQLKDFHYLGIATIDGTVTHHYQGVNPAPELNGTAIPVTFRDAEVWVDRSGLVRQLTSTVTTGAATFGDHHELSNLTVTVTIDFTGYGTPVNIQPPSPDKVVQEPVISLSRERIAFRTSHHIDGSGRGLRLHPFAHPRRSV
jgi:hypothetical protein